MSFAWITTKIALVLALVAMSQIASALAPAKNWLVVDFDGTCTQKDTICMLPRLAALAENRRQQQKTGIQNGKALSPDAAMELQSRLSIFSMLEEEYFRKYRQAMDSMKPQEDETVHPEKLAETIDALDAVSTAITHEVSNWRVLGGLGDVTVQEMLELVELYKENQAMLEPKKIGDRPVDLDELLQCLTLQDGCLPLLNNCLGNNYDIGVLSINWCPVLIESLLVHPLCAANDKLKPENMPIWSNSVDQEGIVSLPYEGAIAKRQKIAQLQENESKVIYVGDSSTDLLAILQADVGILLPGSTSATGLAQRYGVSVRPLSECGDSVHANTVWTANSWDEIRSFLETQNYKVPTRNQATAQTVEL